MNLRNTKSSGAAYSGKFILLRKRAAVCFINRVSEEILVILSRKWQKSSFAVMNVNMKVYATAHIVVLTSCLHTVETLIFRDKLFKQTTKKSQIEPTIFELAQITFTSCQSWEIICVHIKPEFIES